MTINWGTSNEPPTKCFQVQRHAPCQSLSIHEILVPYALPILLPQTALFRFPTRPVIRQLGLVEQLPQPRRILLVDKGEHGGLVLEVVQSDEDGVRGAGGPRACICKDVSCVIFWVGWGVCARGCSPPVWGVQVAVVRSGTVSEVAPLDLDANKREWRVRVGCRS
jgi:hypothetical protein